jgi:hypothetical protein
MFFLLIQSPLIIPNHHGDRSSTAPVTNVQSYTKTHGGEKGTRLKDTSKVHGGVVIVRAECEQLPVQ